MKKQTSESTFFERISCCSDVCFWVSSGYTGILKLRRSDQKLSWNFSIIIWRQFRFLPCFWLSTTSEPREKESGVFRKARFYVPPLSAVLRLCFWPCFSSVTRQNTSNLWQESRSLFFCRSSLPPLWQTGFYFKKTADFLVDISQNTRSEFVQYYQKITLKKFFLQSCRNVNSL